jgi:hypothetical protein
MAVLMDGFSFGTSRGGSLPRPDDRRTMAGSGGL